MNPSNSDDIIAAPNAPNVDVPNSAALHAYPPVSSGQPAAYPPPSSPYLGGHNHPVPSYPPQTQNQFGYPPVSQPQLPQTVPPPAGYASQFPYPPQSFADTTVANFQNTNAPTYTTPLTPSHHSHAYPPQTTPGYPPQSTSGYPPQNIPGYPPQNVPSYPPQNIPGFPAYPPQPAYPPNSVAYPPQSTGYPPLSAVPGCSSQTPPHLNSPTNNICGIFPAPIGIITHSDYSAVPQTPSAIQAAHHHQQSAPAKRVELGNPTVKPAPHFNADSDAQELHETLKLSSPNKDILINILCHRNLEQRFEIAKKYAEVSNGADLVHDIKQRFDCNFQKILVALLTPLIDFYVQELNESLEMYDHDSTIDIMCPLSNYEMYTLKYVYQKKFGIPLETEVRSKTSEHLKRLLLSICACSRDETGITNLATAQFDARQLASQENPYDDDRFCHYKDIFSTRNFQQIKLISEEYLKITGQPLEKTIKSKFIMDDKQGYLCIVRYSQDKHGFFAKRLHRSMAGMGTNDNQLIRLVVTRCEIDLQDIKDKFGQMFGKSLRSWIKGDTSGHYKYCLYELIGEKRSNK